MIFDDVEKMSVDIDRLNIHFDRLNLLEDRIPKELLKSLNNVLPTKNNIDKQLRFLERSASQGNVTAQFNYGVFLSDTNPTLSEYYNFCLGKIILLRQFA